MNVYHIYIVGIRLAGRQVDAARKSDTVLAGRADAPDPPPKLPTHGERRDGSLVGAGTVWALSEALSQFEIPCRVCKSRQNSVEAMLLSDTPAAEVGQSGD